MTELDFEELDKAVSDLMKDTDSEQSDTQSAPLAIDTPSTPLGQAGASQQAVPVQVQPENPTPQPAPVVPAIRRGGRFMDVKPLSGNLPTARPAAPAAYNGPLSGSAVPVNEAPDTPTPGPKVEEEPQMENSNIGEYAPTPVVDSESTAPPENIEHADLSTENTDTDAGSSSSSFTMPDPIDVANDANNKPEDELSAVITPEVSLASDTAEPDKAPTEPALDEQTVENDSADQHENGMESPFIPDAKVEKRPLGGISSDATEGASEESGQQDATLAPAPLPRELSSDLMNLETDGNDVAVAPIEDKKDAKEAPVQEAPKAAESAPQAPVAQPVADVKPTGGMYDTDAYHNMPLGAPVKKKHGWMVIVWILILLIVGACAGAAYFYFTTMQ